MSGTDAGAGSTAVRVKRWSGNRTDVVADVVATEEPLEIRLAYRRNGMQVERAVAVTMRTPGADEELAVGFLLTEGVIPGYDAIDVIAAIPEGGREAAGARLRVSLVEGAEPRLATLERHFYTTSSCGVCGKAALEALRLRGEPMDPGSGPFLDPALLMALPAALREKQETFAATGGLHASGLFTGEGACLAVREDVGRHNALDKVIGWAARSGAGLDSVILVVSGRTSFEIMQKALAARIPVVVAVGAPSSLAVEVADRFQMTLVGFVKGERFNLYSGRGRMREGL